MDYKEKLEEAKRLYQTANKDQKYMLEKLFPELIESEDEKIRKIISDILLIDSDEIREILDTNNVLMQDIDAWLEKQGEQMPIDKVEPKFKVGDIIKEKGLDETYEVIKYIDNGFAFIDKYGEIFTAYYDDDSLDYYEIVERKSVEWSEQDETGLGDALWAIEQARTIAKDENDMGNLWYAEHWLKSLKGRVGCEVNCITTKEVELEKETQTLWSLNQKSVNSLFILMNYNGLREIAKHFFELGLRSTITEEDCKLIWNIGDDLPYMPEEDFFKELLRRYKAQKGE